jgi:RNA polymerase sigma-70 factor (ECF subfamily)
LFERKAVENPQEFSVDSSIEESFNKRKTLSPDEFARFYDSYYPRLYRYLSYRTATREEAEDLVEAVFERIINKFHTFDSKRGSLDAWVFTIARHILANRHRYQSRHPELPLEEGLAVESGSGLSEFVVEQEEIQRLRRYLGRLNEREKELLALRYGAELPHRRIGELLGMSEGNVTVSLGRAVRKLRGFFEAEENE